MLLLLIVASAALIAVFGIFALDLMAGVSKETGELHGPPPMCLPHLRVFSLPPRSPLPPAALRSRVCLWPGAHTCVRACGHAPPLRTARVAWYRRAHAHVIAIHVPEDVGGEGGGDADLPELCAVGEVLQQHDRVRVDGHRVTPTQVPCVQPKRRPNP